MSYISKAMLIELFKEIQIFKNLNNAELNELASISLTTKYTAGTVVFLQGDISQYVMMLLEGTLRIYKHDSKGNEVVIGVFQKYSFLAEAATLRKTPLPSTARLETDGIILKIPIEKFEKFTFNNPTMSYQLVQSLLEKMDLLQQNIHLNLATSSEEKVLNFYQNCNPPQFLDQA